MSLTRRDVLRFAGGAVPGTVTLPRPFTIPLPVPPVLRPARSDATTDYYEVAKKRLTTSP
jgi:spore coat protein A